MTDHRPTRRPLSERASPSPVINPPKPRALAVAVHAALFSLALGAADLTLQPAQAADAPVAAPTRKTYSLPPGPLDDALNRFAREAGVLLSFDPQLTEGINSKGLNGNYSTEEGFAALLNGTGLTSRVTNNNTVTLERALARRAEDASSTSTGTASAAGVTTLPRVTVTAGRETNFDVDEGFKAEFQTSATKLPLTIRETPQSVSVITRDSLEARQVLNLGQALELSAGVVQYSGNGPFAGQPSFGFNQTTIRGIDIDSIFDFREDGFINGSFYSVTDLAIYERVDIVKGPSSVLYGRGSAGGLINRVRKKPLAEFESEFAASVGSFDFYRADVDITGPLFESDRVRGRLVAAYEDSGSFVRGPETQRTVIAPSLDIDLSPTTRLLLQGLYQSEDIIPNTGTPLRRVGDNFEAAPRINRRDYQGIVTRDPYTWETTSLTAQLEQELGNNWLATLRLNNSNIDTPIRVDAYAYGILDADGNTGILGNDFQIDRDVWSGELQLAGTVELWGREAKLGFGLDHNENQYSRNGAYTEYLSANLYDRVIPLPDRATLTPGFATEGAPQSQGAYAQAHVRPTERLAVLLGLRYDQVENDTTPFYSLTTDENGDGIPDGSLVRQTDKREEVTGRIGLTYELSEQVSVYGLYAQSFTPELFSSDANGELLEPQTGEIYEIGAKTEWFDGKLGLNAAIYRIDRENIATSVPDDPTDDIPPFSISSGLQRSDGFEIEVNGQPRPGWDISLAFNQLDSAYEDERDPLFGFQPGGTPDWQLGLYSAYELQSGPLKGLGFGATLFAIDDRGVGFSPGTIPGYERLDLHAFYKGFENIDINLVVRNVTDEVYIEGADRPGAYAQFGSPTAVLLTVRTEFGK